MPYQSDAKSQKRKLAKVLFIYGNIMSRREIKGHFDKACDERKEIRQDIKQLHQNHLNHLAHHNKKD